MKIEWLGHASFYIQTNGKRITTDPFDERLGYPVYGLESDLVTISHEHWDHNADYAVKGSPIVVRKDGISKFDDMSITVQGFQSYHDKVKGQARGFNTIYKISSEDIEVLHLGDLGHLLTKEEVIQIGNVDILLIPVGGTYTIDANEAYELVNFINPKVVIPMHFKTPHLKLDIDYVEKFIQKYNKVIKKPYLEVSKNDISDEMQIIVLDYLI
ncbi:Zn-dependent hydrolases of the metallo-beta-lactamase superfamily [Candidatus Syntrophocurvum alkaliphilum]|uniref:Zn-dependent hydrolases of the metallo-beta-lactamase superfamily n=1 Tax=Candidatus Syntrophocurvum alkaliphilum TaxID=2293317 RepID=A0A6I6DLK8_9FIRM|nr:MBL fold metallo-hydrolase [Candidatus Syntrophocurvum alkaliphilum]QGU00697.1 Zn-dependent hydrolases of the metallo-beta-lactamase superfamily [Candidatus Syntrophocurvum alkaliphilum]